MRVRFHIPPPKQRTGGLDAAVTALASALAEQGVTLLDDAATEPPDVVHFHGLWQFDFPSKARLARAQGSAIVCSPHGMLEPWAWRHKRWKKWPYFHLREKAFLRSADCLLATAPKEAERLRERFPGTKVETLPLGITGSARPGYSEARNLLGWAPSDNVLLFLSRVHEKKGLDLLLAALTQVQTGPSIRLVIVGGGAPAYVQEMRRFTIDYSTQLPRVDWVGEVWGEDRWKYFQGADLFCLPTYSENFGLVVLEALQVGTPVLTTNETPWADYAREGRIVIGSPTVESIRLRLSKLLRRPRISAADREELASWTHDRFSWKTLAPEYAALYRKLIDARERKQKVSG